MKTLSLSLKGGLGNNLFQIASVYAFALRDNLNFVINPHSGYGHHKNLHHYRTNIFRKIEFTELTDIAKNHNHAIFEFVDLNEFTESFHLEGYFQSEKYFVNFREKILELFEISEEIKENILNSFGDISDEEKTCSIHVRRGDYLGLKDHHPVLPIDYYISASNFFEHDTKFIIFSDDINWCKTNFDFLENKVFVDCLLDYEQLYLMSFCKNNIIANSTFSWWGAWLNKNSEKKIIAPKNWFGPALASYNTKDLIPETWIKI